jgi:hypothetical protein
MKLHWLLVATVSVAYHLSTPIDALSLPIAPDTGTPKGNSTPGTTRRPEISCQETIEPLTALVANNGKDYTIAAHPNFWFYVPYPAGEIASLEFLLLDGQESQTIYKTKVDLHNKAGIIKVSLPQKAPYALEVGKKYRWYFLLDCVQNTTSEPDLVVDGWIARVSINPQLTEKLKLAGQSDYAVYQENQLWFDGINALINAYFNAPDRPELRSAWSHLWHTLNYQWLISKTSGAAK